MDSLTECYSIGYVVRMWLKNMFVKCDFGKSLFCQFGVQNLVIFGT